MKLICLGSSSQGNCYILKGKSQSLILETGVKFKEVKIALNHIISDISGVLITHEHQDHAKYAKEYEKSFIPVFSASETLEAMKVKGTALNHLKTTNIGDFRVMPINSIHDAVHPFNYLIEHPECGRILFITDSSSFNYKVPNVRHFLVEANFCEDIVSEKLVNNPDMYNNLERLQNSHMSIEETKKTLKNNVCGETNSITLIHLSNGNSDANRFKRECQELTGIPTYVADKGFEFEY